MTDKAFDYMGMALILAIMVAFGAFINFMVSDYKKLNGPRGVPAYAEGEIVTMRAFGTRGMVVDSYCALQSYGGACTYSVRFAAIQSSTNTSTLGADGPLDVAPVAVVHRIREYELERAGR